MKFLSFPGGGSSEMLVIIPNVRARLLRRFITTVTPGHHSHAAPTIKDLKSHRPLSPHVTIYQPQLTWLMSIGHRVTGAGLTGVVYGFGITSSLNLFPGNLTMKICELVSVLPLPMVLAGKFILATPFMYHLFNGVRHLIWDTGKALTLRGVYATGWAVNIATLISSTLLTFL